MSRWSGRQFGKQMGLPWNFKKIWTSMFDVSLYRSIDFIHRNGPVRFKRTKNFFRKQISYTNSQFLMPKKKQWVSLGKIVRLDCELKNQDVVTELMCSIRILKCLRLNQKVKKQMNNLKIHKLKRASWRDKKGFSKTLLKCPRLYPWK